MIKYFAVENYRSIQTEEIVEFDININSDSPYGSHPIVGVAGANAAGKSTLLQALSFVIWFMQDSFTELEPDKKIPYEPFLRLDNHPTRCHLIFEKVFEIEGASRTIAFEYLLSLAKYQVLSEQLSYSDTNATEVLLYQRDEAVVFGKNINSIPVDSLRNNCSIISYAAQYKQPYALACKNYNFMTNVTHLGLHQYKFELEEVIKALNDALINEKLKKFIRIADIGIEDIYLEKDLLPMPELLELGDSVEDLAKQSDRSEMGHTQQLYRDIEQLYIYIKEVRRIIASSRKMEDSLKFKHQVGDELTDFTTQLESAGTLQFMAILLRILAALRDASVLIIDEIELKLHQNLVAYLIGLFQNPSENRHGAQLIFSFHNSFLMEILAPEQLWLAEKDAQGCTHLFCANDFEGSIKDLHEKDLELLYRAGRFGAKPREL